MIYFHRYTPSQADVHVFTSLASAPDPSLYPNTARWYNHIKSYEPEHKDLAGSSAGGEAFTVGGVAPAEAAAEEDEEIDLFGDDDEEEDAEAERIKAERVAAYNEKKANKPKTIAKVSPHFFSLFFCHRTKSWCVYFHSR